MPKVRTQDVVFNSYLSSDFSLSLDSKFGCNLNSTDILNALPTDPTTSQGTYIFRDKKGSTVFLNATGTDGDNTSAIRLLQCSSTSAPSNVLQADKNGITGKSFITNDGGLTSTLTATQLIIQGIDYKALVDTHTTQISNLAAVDVSELARLSDLEAVDITLQNRLNEIETKQPIIIGIPIYYVPSLYADSTGRADYIPASVSAVTPYTGLYYKNNLNEKINWYIGNDGQSVGDIKAVMLNFYNVSALTGLGTPFINVYTKIDNITPNAASWYKSRKTFSIDYTATTTINTAYALLADLKSVPYSPLAYGHVKVNATTIPANDKGNFADDEKILFFAISTSSNSAAGLFEFIASKFTIYTDKASTEFNMQQL
jgi:hypothetical protein